MPKAFDPFYIVLHKFGFVCSSASQGEGKPQHHSSPPRVVKSNFGFGSSISETDRATSEAWGKNEETQPTK